MSSVMPSGSGGPSCPTACNGRCRRTSFPASFAVVASDAAPGVPGRIAHTTGPGKAIARALMKRREVRNLRVLFADLPGCAGYKLSGEGVPLEQIDSRMAQRIHAGLNAAAYAVLGRRTELGWSARYDQLWT